MPVATSTWFLNVLHQTDQIPDIWIKEAQKQYERENKRPIIFSLIHFLSPPLYCFRHYHRNLKPNKFIYSKDQNNTQFTQDFFKPKYKFNDLILKTPVNKFIHRNSETYMSSNSWHPSIYSSLLNSDKSRLGTVWKASTRKLWGTSWERQQRRYLWNNGLARSLSFYSRCNF